MKKKSGQKVKVGYPRFKRVDRYKSFTFPQVWMAVRDKRLEVVKFRPVTPSTPEGKAELKKQQRCLSKKRKGSVNYQAQKIVLARTHEHVGNQRADFLHKLSLSLVIAYAYIAFEQLNIPGMVRNAHLAKSILDAGWGTLIRFVAYKSVMLRGNEIERVNQAYSSQDCSGLRIQGAKDPRRQSA